jgi:hypothetical protein
LVNGVLGNLPETGSLMDWAWTASAGWSWVTLLVFAIGVGHRLMQF